MKKLVAILVMGLLIPNFAYAYCSEPSAPSSWSKPTKPIKPSTPYCVNQYSNTHTCDDWTINSYNNDINSYNSQLQSYNYAIEDYVRKLHDYVDDAQDYANCEIRSLSY